MRSATWLVLGSCLVLGCGSGGSSGGGQLDASTDADSGLDGGTTPDGGTADACTRFVTCSLAVQPASAAGTLAAYGPDGACWKIQAKEACEQACRDGISALHQIEPSAPECALCVSDADCQGATPVCSPTKGECTQCKSSAQCSAPLPACDPASGTCVACVSSADCGAPSPACDTTTHTCVECTSGADCSSGSCQSDHTCCEAVSPCSASSCGSVYDNCGKSVECGGCPAGQFCDSSFCTVISNTFPCNLSGKSNTCTKYLQYCQYYFNGPGGTTAWCSAMPASCQANPTCACLSSAGEFYPPDTCTPGTGPDGAGVLFVTSKP